MKLKNKKTGEIVDTLCEHDCTKGLCLGVDHHDGNPTMACYNSLAELNSEWEDYEEPKDYWFIDCAAPYPVDFCEFNEDTEDDKAIGNYFETKEEAEMALRKLKAWKRLKDKGFRFTFWDIRSGSGKDGHCEGEFVMFSECPDDIEKADLDLLFGGEE